MGIATRWRRMVRRWIWIYPPFLFSGIGVKCLSKKPLTYRTSLKKRWWNQNAVGTHFGGSLFAMTDPFFMLILMEELGREFIVWDQKSTIDFIKAGTKTVFAEFAIPSERIQEIRDTCQTAPIHPEFSVEIVDTEGEVVARVRKTIYIRRRKKRNDG